MPSLPFSPPIVGNSQGQYFMKVFWKNGVGLAKSYRSKTNSRHRVKVSYDQNSFLFAAKHRCKDVEQPLEVAANHGDCGASTTDPNDCFPYAVFLCYLVFCQFLRVLIFFLSV